MNLPAKCWFGCELSSPVKGGSGGFRLANCIKPGLFCFRCPKISQSKAAWYRLWRSDVYVLNVPSGHIKTCAAVRGSTTLCYGQAD